MNQGNTWGMNHQPGTAHIDDYRGDFRGHSMRNPINSGYPANGKQDRTFPFNGQQMIPTHPYVYPDGTTVADIAIISTFYAPPQIAGHCLPLTYFDGERLDVKYTYGQVRSMPMHSEEAPHETFHFIMTKASFWTQMFGLMFMVDDSILRTPFHSVFMSRNMKLMHAAIRLTIYEQSLGCLLTQPNIHYREREYQERTLLAQTDVSAHATRRMMDSFENMTGILDRDDLYDHGFTKLLQEQRKHIDAAKVDDSLKITYQLWPGKLRDSIETNEGALSNEINDIVAEHFIRQKTGLDELRFYLHPFVSAQYRGINIIYCEAYKTANAFNDPMLSTHVDGEAYVIDTEKYWAYQIFNHESGSWEDVFRHGSEAIRSEVYKEHGTLQDFKNSGWVTNKAHIATKVPADQYNTAALPHFWEGNVTDEVTNGRLLMPNGIRFMLIFRNHIANNVLTIIAGIGGHSTGFTALGREVWDRYHLDPLQRSETHVMMRFAVCIVHPGQISRHPSVKYVQHIGGAGAKCCPGSTSHRHFVAPNTSGSAADFHLSSSFRYYGNPNPYKYDDITTMQVSRENGYANNMHLQNDGSQLNDIAKFWLPLRDISKSDAEATRLQNVRAFDAGGSFDTLTKDALLQSNEFRWISTENRDQFLRSAAYSSIPGEKKDIGTFIRPIVNMEDIADFGLNGNPNTRCWNTRGRGQTLNGDWVLEGQRRGPYKWWDEPEMKNVWNDAPRSRSAKRKRDDK